VQGISCTKSEFRQFARSIVVDLLNLNASAGTWREPLHASAPLAVGNQAQLYADHLTADRFPLARLHTRNDAEDCLSFEADSILGLVIEWAV
jgi:hypothetical protein